jgi:hypothetical protein
MRGEFFSSPPRLLYYPIGTRQGTLLSGVKLPGGKADHTPPSSDEVKNAWSQTSMPPFVFVAWWIGTTLQFT